jgi:hypothetical protein
VFKRKVPLWSSLKHAVLQNIMSENLNCQATFDTSFPLPQNCKITLNDGKIIAEKCIQVE